MDIKLAIAFDADPKRMLAILWLLGCDRRKGHWTRGVENVAHPACVGTVVSAIHRRSDAARQWMDNLQARTTDGVILVASDLERPLQAELRRLAVPAVVVDPVGTPVLEAPTIGTTNWAGGLSATEHLLNLAFKQDPHGDPEVLAELKILLARYLGLT